MVIVLSLNLQDLKFLFNYLIMVVYSKKFVKSRLSPKLVRKELGICIGSCTSCKYYDAVSNVCNVSSIAIEFPALESSSHEPCPCREYYGENASFAYCKAAHCECGLVSNNRCFLN